MTTTLKIQPVDLVDLTVTTDHYAYTLADFTVSGGFLVGEIDATLSVSSVTISSSGYATQSFMYRNLPSEVVLVAQEVEILSDGTESYQISDKVARANITTLDSRVDSIEEKIPAEASSSNQLADKSYVDGRIPPIAYGTSTSAATTVEKVVSIPEITELNEGQIIVVQPTITSTVANSTIKLNDFDAYPMRYSGAAITTSTDATVWSVTYPSQFVFDGSHWVFLGHGTDTNTTYTINYSIDAGAYKSGIGNYAITRYSLCMQKPDMTWEKVTATTSTYSTGTSKSVNTRGFILGNIRYYNTTAIVANGANTASNTMNEKAATLDFRYSTNCGSTPGYATGDYVYFVGTIGADGLFYLDTTQWWTNTLPTTNDGKLYVQIGKFLADYNVTLYENHPAYYYDGSKLCEYKVADNKQDTISDLSTIRSGATLGASSLQPGDNVSELTNDSGYITGINSSDVTTALGYTPANDNAVVKTSGTQTVRGVKTFTSDQIIKKSAPRLYIDNTDYTKNTAPDGNRESFIVYRDSANKWIGMIRNRADSSLTGSFMIASYKQNTTSDVYSQLENIYQADGKYFLKFSVSSGGVSDTNLSLVKSTTSTTDTTIPCMGWVNAKLAVLFTSITGYDATKTQTLKNVNGTLTWVTD